MVCRWGFIFIQGMLDAVYPVTSGRPRPPTQLDLTEAVWSDLRFWLLALLGLIIIIIIEGLSLLQSIPPTKLTCWG